ncbi:uncharacterized protein LOC115889250 [Sitophilus oryzae]|uniref:Uncharacterized protein LOC115889250 n=1 Tax=Sitophilus oryzae TaxID=7048 RepID=A0A6J2YQI3_SITOR|nr:uncharacterized protein LOC115889250 [Sitophilus oryzae]
MCSRGRDCARENSSRIYGNAPPPSHRTVQISMERSPTRGEFPGMNNFSEYTVPCPNLRIPPAARAFPGPYANPAQFDTLGPQIDYNLGWIPKDINLSELLDQGANQMSSRFRRPEQNFTPGPSPYPPAPDQVSPNANPLLEREQRERDERNTDTKSIGKKTQESLIEWFDRSVEKELKKHKENALGAMLNLAPPPPLDSDTLPELNISRGTLERLAEATASQMEVCFQLRREPDTELADAVEKLAKAETMCAFAGAVQAAEAAAEAAPPELAEEAAVASARGFQTEVATSNFHQNISGVRPIEVIGYIGITKPKYPTKRK